MPINIGGLTTIWNMKSLKYELSHQGRPIAMP
jgi:hypothetical protein